MNYKIFNRLEDGVYHISVDKIDESLDYYEYVSAQKDKGKRQVIMTMNYLLHVAEGLSNNYSVKAIEVDVDDKYKHVIGKMLKMVNDDNTTYEVLELALKGILEGQGNSIGVKAILLDNGKDVIELRVNGVIKFTGEPSKELKNKIAQLTEEKFNEN